MDHVWFKSKCLLGLFVLFIELFFIFRAQFTTLLDLRRANNISINLSHFTRRNMTEVDIVSSVIKLNDKALTVDDILSISKMLPSSEERYRLEQFLKMPKPDSLLPLAPAETFMLETMNHPDFPQYTHVFLYKLNFPKEMEILADRIDQMMSTCASLTTSDHLKILLRTVAKFGKMSVEEFGIENSSYRPWMGKDARMLGFKIDGLARLKDIKSADGNWSLMNILISLVYQTKPEVF
jgi:hypothetical protein